MEDNVKMHAKLYILMILLYITTSTAYEFMNIENTSKVFSDPYLGFGGSISKKKLNADSTQYSFNKNWSDGSSLVVSVSSGKDNKIKDFTVIGTMHSNFENFESLLFPMTCLMFSPTEIKEKIQTWIKANVTSVSASSKIGAYDISYNKMRTNNSNSYVLEAKYLNY